MNSISAIVRQVLTQGYLDLTTENNLRRLLQTTKYELVEIHAFAELQAAVFDGRVRQQSREQLAALAWQRHRPRCADTNPSRPSQLFGNARRSPQVAVANAS